MFLLEILTFILPKEGLAIVPIISSHHRKLTRCLRKPHKPALIMHIFFPMTETKTNPKRIVEASTRQVAAQAFRFSLDSAWWISSKPAPTNPCLYTSSPFELIFCRMRSSLHRRDHALRNATSIAVPPDKPSCSAPLLVGGNEGDVRDDGG